MKVYFKLYNKYIEEMKTKAELKILDVGGGGGAFARFIKEQAFWGGNESVKLKIIVIDTTEYDAWTIKDNNIEYILCDAMEIGEVFEKESFDYIFCNMFVHHLIGNSYKESENIRIKVLKAVRKVLKRDGKLLIADNLNDGFIFDSISCRMIYTLTTCANPVLQSCLKKMGVRSAGSGVCMMSEKMWGKLLENTGFKIVYKVLSEPDNNWSLIKRMVLLNKSYRQQCLLAAERDGTKDSPYPFR